MYKIFVLVLMFSFATSMAQDELVEKDFFDPSQACTGRTDDRSRARFEKLEKKPTG